MCLGNLLKRLFELPYPLSDCPNSWSVDILLLVLASAVAESVLASRYLGTQREES